MTTQMNPLNPEQTMTRFPLLTINEHPLPWEQILGQLQLFGKLQPFLRELVSQYVLIQEINTREGLTVNSADVVKEIIEFQQTHNLTDQHEFQNWLQHQNLDDAMFQQRIVLGLKLKQLRQQIAEPNLHPYFEAHRDAFEQVRLSCLFTAEEPLAHELKDQLAIHYGNFVQLANDYAASIPPVRFLEQQVQRRSLPASARDSLASAAVGTIIGPVQIKGDWGILRLEEVIPAELSDRLKSQIEAQLFSQWLAEKIRSLNINFNIASEPVAEEDNEG